jgi:hypothetical protein
LQGSLMAGKQPMMVPRVGKWRRLRNGYCTFGRYFRAMNE